MPNKWTFTIKPIHDLLNEEIDDIDIATTLTTDQIKKKLEGSKFEIIESGIKHGTVTLVS